MPTFPFEVSVETILLAPDPYVDEHFNENKAFYLKAVFPLACFYLFLKYIHHASEVYLPIYA